MILTQLIFWICVWALAHSYVGYPLILKAIVAIKGEKKFKTYTSENDLPFVSILMAAFNEEPVIEKKIRSIIETSYNVNKIEIFVGSDNSTDATNEILRRLSDEFEPLIIKLFTERQGKVNIINQLSEMAVGDILFITDANVMFEKDTIYETVKYFCDERVGLVDTHMTNYGIKKNGISFQEKSYISHEVYVKQLESQSFGNMIGPFGGCYAIRKNLFVKVPTTYLVDDFFICMSVLDKGKFTINSFDAIVVEDVSNILKVEFNRKIRIAIGNFQNLLHFQKLLWPPYSPVGFSFLSHKVLRWFGPVFLIVALITNILLRNESGFYQMTLLLQLFVTFLPFIDMFLKKIGIHIVLLRFATHFYTMNLSLLIGLVKSLKGVKSNVWKPTERFQE